jgi:RNA polymerase sigma factor (sigma-70 family)
LKADRQSIVKFFTDEYRKMTGYVRSLIEDSSDLDSEDIVQDVMTGVFEAADISRPIENLSAYVYRSLKNRVIDRMRKRRDTLSLEEQDAETGISLLDILEDYRYDPETEVFMEIFRDALFASIEKLPDEQKAVFIMTEFESMTYRDISEKSGVPVGTLLSRKSRALERIKKDLSQFINFTEE